MTTSTRSTSSGPEEASAAERAACPPMADDLACPNCGRRMVPEHAHHKCPACGYIDPCCGW